MTYLTLVAVNNSISVPIRYYLSLERSLATWRWMLTDRSETR